MTTFSKRALRKGEEGFNLFKSLQRLRRRLIRARRKKPIRRDWLKQRAANRPLLRSRFSRPRSRGLRYVVRTAGLLHNPFCPKGHSIAPEYAKNIFQIRERLGVPQDTPYEVVRKLIGYEVVQKLIKERISG